MNLKDTKEKVNNTLKNTKDFFKKSFNKTTEVSKKSFTGLKNAFKSLFSKLNKTNAKTKLNLDNEKAEDENVRREKNFAKLDEQENKKKEKISIIKKIKDAFSNISKRIKFKKVKLKKINFGKIKFSKIHFKKIDFKSIFEKLKIKRKVKVKDISNINAADEDSEKKNKKIKVQIKVFDFKNWLLVKKINELAEKVKAKNAKKPKKTKKVKFCEDNLFVTVFSVMVLILFISFFNPYNANSSSIVLSNKVDVDTVDGKVEKAKAIVDNRLIESFPFYDSALKGYYSVLTNLNTINAMNMNDDELVLINSSKHIYTNKDKTNLIIKYEIDAENALIELNNKINFFNNLYVNLNKRDVDLSIYSVNSLWTSEAILNFDVDEKEPLKYVELFKKGLNENIKFDYLKMIDFTTFKEYFFKTDHHWKIQGAYQGYKDIMNMYKVPEKDLIEPNFFEVEKIKFIGSNARACLYDKIYDSIYDIEFDKEYEISKNGKKIKKDELSMKSKYLSGEFEEEEFYNHYAKYFREDTGELIYTFADNENKDNLLILADSFSNCIELEIASHFHNTHVIDLRYYEKDMKEKFDIYNYIEKNNINSVLFLYSANNIYFESTEMNIE